MIPDVAFDLELEHGRCVGVRLPEVDGIVDALAEAALLPEERREATRLKPVRRRTWVGGRVALRHALAREGLAAPPVLADGRGAPVVPPGIAASISHKEDLAVALVAREPSSRRIGVDVEADARRSVDIASKVLAADEGDELASLDAAARAREVLLRFSAKEAVYKALDPFLQRYVAFREVSVSPRPDGTAEVRTHLPAAEGPFVVEVRWLRFDGLVLTTARVRRG